MNNNTKTMKINLLFITFLGICLCISCSKNDDIGNNDDKDKPGTAEAYASVSIQLPSIKGNNTRAAYDPGKDDEYKVQDVTIIFFRTPDGVTEANTAENAFIISDIVSTIPELNTRKGSLNIVVPDGGGSPGSITKSFKTGPIQVDPSAIRAVAALNIAGVASIASSILRVGNSFAQLNQSIPLVDLKHITGDNFNNFLMTSAPVWKNSKVTTLAVCQPQATEKDAVDHPVSMQVERLVAKVELKANDARYIADATGAKYFTIADGLHQGDKISIEGWEPATTNRQSFPFRQAKDWEADYNIVWKNAILDGQRIHWAEDPNYEGNNWPVNSFHNPTSINIDRDWATRTKYCVENTSHYGNMNKSQTTRLIIRAKYIPNALNQAGGDNTTNPDGTWWSFSSVAAHYSIQNLYVQLISRVKSSLETSGVNDSPNTPLATNVVVNADQMQAQSNGWTITLEQISGYSQRFNLKLVNYVSTTDGTTKKLTTAQIDAFKTTTGHLQKYDQGICYYAVFIRHFTNAEGGYADDWNNTDGHYTAAQQGRYGMVRNNWYTITVNSISNPGEPEIPDTPEVPVDERTAYIDCDIEITAWARRNQSEDL